MTGEACRSWRGRLAASLVGELEPDEGIALRAHLDGCAACRAEVAELGAVMALLPLADVDRIGTVPPPPPGLADRIVSRVADERGRTRRRRMRLGASALGIAAVLALLAVLVPTWIGEDRVGVTLRGPSGASASATLASKAWGTEIALDVSGLAAGDSYGVWLERPDGSRAPAGTFVAVAEREMHLVLAAGLALDGTSGLGVSTLDGETVMYSTVTPPT